MSEVKRLQKAMNDILGAGLKEDGIAGPNTLSALRRLCEYFRSQTGGTLQDTFVAWRRGDTFTNTFADYLFLFEEGEALPAAVPCSTVAGWFYVKNPLRVGGVQGTAVLKEGYYERSHQAVITYRFGRRSTELIQVRPVVVYRDGNRDDRIDRDSPTQTGLFGINIHEAGTYSRVDRWSAGCIVVPRKEWDSCIVPRVQLRKRYSLLLTK